MIGKIKLSIKELFYFTIPLIIGQIGQMLFNVGDTFVAGRYSTTALASIGVGSAITAPFIMLGVASLFAVSSISSRYRGEGHCPSDKNVWGSSLIFCSILSIILTTLLYLLAINIELIGLNPEIVADVKTYLIYVGASLIPALFFQNTKEYLQSFDKTIFANSLIIIMNIFNVLLNWILMFGYENIPSLGIKGAAISTVITRSLMMIILFAYTFKVVPCAISFTKERIKELTHIGLPVGLATLIEILMFSTVTILIGKMPIHISAAHNIVLNLSGLTFMVPLAISGTAGVKVSYALGQNNPKKLESYALGCLFMAEAFMFFTAAIYILFPQFLTSLFTNDPAVIAYGSSLFLYVALFQIPDGVQVTMWGILRGMGITKHPLILTFCGHWLIAIPAGALLAYKFNMQAKGLWAGLAIGLTVVSIPLVGIYLKNIRKLFLENRSESLITKA
jgi:MATE family multidrug resistance protein